MLKLILMLMMMIFFLKSWNVIQNLLLFLFFYMSLFGYHNFFLFNLGFNLGTDLISYMLVLLSLWILMLVIYASHKIKAVKNFPGKFLTTTLILCLALITTFSSLDYLLFYVSFESSLVPTLILILGWGYQPERIQAGVYMLFYTLFASLPLLVSLLSLYKLGGTLTMGLAMKNMSTSFLDIMWYFSTILAFTVKLPLYLFHLWLPKAHVEAPVAGSMVLAGVLLKLGGYGLVRLLPLFMKINKMMSWMWITVGILGGVMVSFICLHQVDMKSLIAYSSVAHMGMVLCGFMVLSSWGLNGGMVVMIGHGLCSSGLFCLANMVYERTGSRSLLISKGLLNFMPSMGLWWFLLSIGNMAAPPSLNLLGEINLIISIISWSKISMYIIALLSFFSAAYTLYMYSLSQHGTFFSSIYSCCPGKVMEYLVLMLHWLPLNILILKGPLMNFI